MALGFDYTINGRTCFILRQQIILVSNSTILLWFPTFVACIAEWRKYCQSGKKPNDIPNARLKPTIYDNSKGTRIGPSLFYTSELHTKYIK